MGAMNKISGLGKEQVSGTISVSFEKSWVVKGGEESAGMDAFLAF